MHKVQETSPDKGNFSDAEAATVQESSVDGEEIEQTIGDSRAFVDTIKCSLEGEISGEWATTPRSTFRTGVEHTEEETRRKRETRASEGSWRSATGKCEDRRSGKRDDIRILVRTPPRDSQGWISVQHK